MGTRAELIQVQATISDGAPAFGVSGVPGISFREARDRVRAAVLNSGLDWPTGAITISLPPASAFRHGCGLDLPIAVAVLAAAGTLPASAGADRGCVFAAELGLDGQLRPVRSLVPVLQAAAADRRPSHRSHRARELAGSLHGGQGDHRPMPVAAAGSRLAARAAHWPTGKGRAGDRAGRARGRVRNTDLPGRTRRHHTRRPARRGRPR